MNFSRNFCLVRSLLVALLEIANRFSAGLRGSSAVQIALRNDPRIFQCIRGFKRTAGIDLPGSCRSTWHGGTPNSLEIDRRGVCRGAHGG
jgi:hypothetical protein